MAPGIQSRIKRNQPDETNDRPVLESPTPLFRSGQQNQQSHSRQEENDARTLAEANVIQNDPERLKGAQNAATRIADEETKRASAMRKVAGKKKQPAKPDSSKASKPSTTAAVSDVTTTPNDSTGVLGTIKGL